jgi:hypothetical protein
LASYFNSKLFSEALSGIVPTNIKRFGSKKAFKLIIHVNKDILDIFTAFNLVLLAE